MIQTQAERLNEIDRRMKLLREKPDDDEVDPEEFNELCLLFIEANKSLKQDMIREKERAENILQTVSEVTKDIRRKRKLLEKEDEHAKQIDGIFSGLAGFLGGVASFFGIGSWTNSVQNNGNKKVNER